MSRFSSREFVHQDPARPRPGGARPPVVQRAFVHSERAGVTPPNPVAASAVRPYRVDILLPPGFRLSELAAVTDCAGALASRIRPQVELRLLSVQGGKVASEAALATVETERFALSPGAGVLVLAGGAVRDQGATLAAFAHQAIGTGRHVAVLSDCVTLLNDRGFFKDVEVCEPWDDPVSVERSASGAERAETVSQARIYAISSRVSTAAGSASTYHLMLGLILRQFGPTVANGVADSLKLGEIRRGEAFQQHATRDRYMVENPKLVALIEIMETAIEEPVPISSLARRVGIGTRQMERLVRSQLSTTPKRLYTDIRLERARWLVEHTAMPLTEIGLSCGFAPQTLSRAYLRHVGELPSQTRSRMRRLAEEFDLRRAGRLDS